MKALDNNKQKKSKFVQKKRNKSADLTSKIAVIRKEQQKSVDAKSLSKRSKF
jgi:hypothetical protein